jgi:hypothetical protein
MIVDMQGQITEQDGWFVVAQDSASYSSLEGDMGTGQSTTYSRFKSKEAAIYYLRSEDYKKRLHRAISERNSKEQERLVLESSLNSIPKWIRRFFGKV